LDVLGHLGYGFSVILTPETLLSCLVGVLLGTLIGVLPGIGAGAAISILLPISFKMTPVSSLVMLTGIFYGAMYGGSTTSILVNIPGESASVITCMDGYQMARQGRAGPALGISAFGSFIAGTFSIIMIMVVAPPLAEAALKFGYPEFFGLILLGITMVSYLARGSKIKALMIAALGMMVATIGQDLVKGTERFSYGALTLMDGVGLVPVIMGIFGIPEILENIEIALKQEVFKAKVKGLLPNLQDWKESGWPIARGTVIGFFLGLLPGVGAMIPTFISYAVEKRLSKTPAKFGTGTIAGVAGPEAANNAGVGGSLIPLLTLGIPPTAIMALLMGALMMQGVQVGPLLIKEHPEVFWGLVASMYVGNGMLLLLNLPLIGLWIRVLTVPYRVLFPLIILFTIVGSYSIAGNKYDILIMLIMGALGYLMRKFNFEPTPFIFAFILGPMFEEKFRQSLLYSSGSFLVFIQRPICAVFVVAAFLLLVSPLMELLLRRREVPHAEEKKTSSLPRRYDLWSGAVLLALGLLYMWEAGKLGIGTPRTPSPGFFPFILGLALCLLCLIEVYAAFVRGRTDESFHGLWHGLRWQKTLLILGSVAAYTFLLEPVGYLITTLVLMAFLFKGIEPQRWWVALTGAVLSSAVTYVLFRILLQVQLPRGVFSFG
jgi:putative tricarboxylic transport membrane protein